MLDAAFPLRLGKTDTEGEFGRKRYSLWGSPPRVSRLLLFFRNSENNEVTEILE